MKGSSSTVILLLCFLIPQATGISGEVVAADRASSEAEASAWETIPTEIGDKPVLNGTVADMVSRQSGYSVLRYGAVGLGAYPYAESLPGARIRVRIDGVPLKSYSPFGPDLELIPASTVDSIESPGVHELNIATMNTLRGEDKRPLTSVGFLLGSQQRFNADVLFSRMVGDKAGILFSGQGSGINGGRSLEHSSLRNYQMKYQRFLENESTLTFAIRAFRDSDGLVTLQNQSHLGERKTDDISVSLGLDRYRLGGRTTVSPVLYYQSANSRFARRGYRKSLDERTIGFHTVMLSDHGNTAYQLRVSHDTDIFDSRIHDDSWTRHESGVSGSVSWNRAWLRMMIRSGVRRSSEYGTGFNFEGELVHAVTGSQDFFLRVYSADEFPDTGMEYYPSLVFSDSSYVSTLASYAVSGIEFGPRMTAEHVTLGIVGFGSFSTLPLFTPSVAIRNGVTGYSRVPKVTMSARKGACGTRFWLDTAFDRRYHWEMTMNGSIRSRMLETGGHGAHDYWPFPTIEVFSDVRMSGTFINQHIQSTLFGNARFLRWAGGEMNPRGNHLLLTSGLVIRVSTLELFYRIENITNESISWFDTLGWQGRNTMWGGRWVFLD